MLFEVTQFMSFRGACDEKSLLGDNNWSGVWQIFKQNFGVASHLVRKSNVSEISTAGRNDMPERLYL
jgi:hypothetical protein